MSNPTTDHTNNNNDNPIAPVNNSDRIVSVPTSENNEEHPPVSSVGFRSSNTTIISDISSDISPIISQTENNKRIKPKTTSRNEKKSNKIKKGSRVKTTRSKLYQVLNTDRQRFSIPPHFPNSAIFHGTVTGGTSGKGWTVKWDDLPSDDNEVSGIKRQRLTVIQAGEEESRYNDKYLEQLKADELAQQKTKKKSPEIESEDRFVSNDADTLKTTSFYECKWNKNEDSILWNIMGETEYIDDDQYFINMKVNSKPKLNPKIDFEKSFHHNFFEHMWPDLKGSGKIIDEYHCHPYSEYHITVVNQNIQFDDPTNKKDPDWKVKQCILCIIASASELENGMNCWKSGSSGGRKSYPDFGQYININEMRAFNCAFPYLYADRKYWYMPKRDIPWDMFMPTIDKTNQKRSELMTAYCLMLDESMSQWRPKTSKFGGLPNYTFEPRKPIPLGTMLRDASECFSGILTYVDPVKVSELQARKEFGLEVTSMPDKGDMPVHTAEVLRQVKNSGLTIDGWVGGDAWFGSIHSSVECFKRFGVHSTWIIKNNSTFFPKRPLNAILTARHGTKVAGKWVTMKTTISGVPLIAVAYAWSQKGVSYFLSTCGNTCPAKALYKTNFEDEFGGTGFKEIKRPEIAEYLYEYLPLIDEHNKQRQNLLNLEFCWPTKNCWFRLCCTLLRIAVTDLYRLYRYHNFESYSNGVLHFSDLICGGLKRKERGEIPVNIRFNSHINNDVLIRIQNENGDITKQTVEDTHTNMGTRSISSNSTIKKRKRGDVGSVGSAIQATCWICRFNNNKNRKPQTRNEKVLPKNKYKYKYTSYCCKHCKTPLCNERRNNTGTTNNKQHTCVDEHLYSQCSFIRCDGKKKRKFVKQV